MTPGTVRFHRVLKAPPERVYRAFLDPEALVKWVPPQGFTGRVLEHEARVGGRSRRAFTNLATGRAHGFGGAYLEREPGVRFRHTDRFDDPDLPGELQTPLTFQPVFRGTEVHILQKGIPAAIPPEACCLGWQESLTLLALLVEPEIPGP